MSFWLSQRKFPILVAHRGASVMAPENTLIAFQKAIEGKADAIEFDVRLSRDGEVVVIHDSWLERTTDGQGKVSDNSVMELKQLSAGKWFDEKYSSERIPLLREVLELCRHRVGINIEIKHHSLRRSQFDFVKRCIRLAKEYRALPEILISSFHHEYLRQAKQLEPTIAIGVLHRFSGNFRRTPISIMKANDSKILICSKTSLTKRMINSIHEHDYRIGVYTVDSPVAFQKLVGAGVNIIFTNDISKMRTAII